MMARVQAKRARAERRGCGVGERLVVGQEVGTMAYMVHDTITAAGAEVLSFNAEQLRMLALSRKKTDRRDHMDGFDHQGRLTATAQLRYTLVQAAHVLIARSRGKEVAPLQEIAAVLQPPETF